MGKEMLWSRHSIQNEALSQVKEEMKYFLLQRLNNYSVCGENQKSVNHQVKYPHCILKSTVFKKTEIQYAHISESKSGHSC